MKFEILAAGWDVRDIESFNQNSESLAEMMSFIMYLFTSHIDPDFVEYANMRFQGVPLLVESSSDKHFVDVRMYIPYDEDVLYFEPDTETKPMHDYLEEYEKYIKGENIESFENIETSCGLCGNADFENSDDNEITESEAIEENKINNEFHDYSNIVYLKTLNDAMLYSQVLMSRGLTDFYSKFVKRKEGDYVILHGFPENTNQAILTKYDMVIAEFASGMEYNPAKSACILEHGDVILKEKAVTVLSSI